MEGVEPESGASDRGSTPSQPVSTPSNARSETATEGVESYETSRASLGSVQLPPSPNCPRPTRSHTTTDRRPPPIADHHRSQTTADRRPPPIADHRSHTTTDRRFLPIVEAIDRTRPPNEHGLRSNTTTVRPSRFNRPVRPGTIPRRCRRDRPPRGPTGRSVRPVRSRSDGALRAAPRLYPRTRRPIPPCGAYRSYA